MIKNSKRILIIFSTKEKLLHEYFFNLIVRSFLLFKCSISLYRDRSIENLFNQSDQSLGEEGLKRIEKNRGQRGIKNVRTGVKFNVCFSLQVSPGAHSTQWLHTLTLFTFSFLRSASLLCPYPLFPSVIYISLPFLLLLSLYIYVFFLSFSVCNTCATILLCFNLVTHTL